EVQLERPPRLGRNPDVLQLPDPGGDAVRERVAFGQALDERAAATHAALRLVGQRHAPAGPRDPDDVVGAEGAAERRDGHAAVPAEGGRNRGGRSEFVTTDTLDRAMAAPA